MRPWIFATLACSAALGSFAACGDDSGPAASCGEETKTYDCATSTVSYANTVEPLATEYCTTCHTSEKTTLRERLDAPLDHDYDTEEGWKASGAHGLVEIQCGRMPKTGGPIPQAQIDKLDEWITCQNLKSEHDHDHAHDES